MTPSSLGRLMGRGLLTLLASRGAVLGLQFATIALLAAHLGPAGLGVYTLALALVSVFRLVPNFGLLPVVNRDITQAPEREPQLLPNLVYMRIGLGVFAYGLLALSVVALGVGADQREAALVGGLALLIAIDAFRTTIEVRLRMGWISAADMAEAVLTVAGTLVLVDADAGVVSFLWLYVGVKTVNALIVSLAAVRMARFDWAPRLALWGPVMRAALPLGLAGVFMALYYRLDIVILAGFASVEDVGQYGAAYRFLEAFTVLPAITMAVLSPVLSRSVVEGAGILARRYGLSVHLAGSLGMFVALVGAGTAWRVLPLLPGFREFDGAGVALSVLAPAAGLILVGTIVQGALISGHLQRRLLTISAIGLAFNLVLNFTLIPPFTYVGAAAATTATEVLLVVLSLREARTRMALRWPAGRLWPLAGTSAGTAVALLAGVLVHPFLHLAAGVVVFVGLAALLGAVRRADVELLLPGRYRAGAADASRST